MGLFQIPNYIEGFYKSQQNLKREYEFGANMKYKYSIKKNKFPKNFSIDRVAASFSLRSNISAQTKVCGYLITFLIGLLVSCNSLASILNIERSNPKIETKSLADIKHQKSVNPTFYFYNSLESEFSKNYEFIFFYSFSCAYCERFAPVLKGYSGNTGISVRGFILGGNSINQESNYFPNSTVVKQEVIESFFDKGKAVAVPALFIMNKKNLHVYPVSQGSLSYSELVRRMDGLRPKILSNEAKITGKNHA